MGRPNILYLHSHDTGRYVQPYGYAVPTPRIQQLAEEGVLFRQAFCAAPTCSPSRAALLTGQWAHCSGMLGLAHRGWRLSDYSRHLVTTLKNAGYETTLCGTQHVAKWDEATTVIGYDREIKSKNDERGAAAAGFLLSRPKQPFFFDVGTFQTHREFLEPACDGPLTDPRYVRPPSFLPDTPDTRRDMAAYNTMARDLDNVYAQVLGALDESGLAQNTIVLCTTDHGVAFPFGKCNLTDHGIGVMMMLRGPGLPQGRVIDAMVSQVDVFPTLCEMIGIDKPDWLAGTSMMPLIRGEATNIREELFAEVTYHAAYEPIRCVRTRRYKYVRRYDDRDKPVLANCDDSISKTWALVHGWLAQRRPQEMLFDLAMDPDETCDLAGRGEWEPVLIEMRSRLDRWMRETNDPILQGLPVPLPSGATINDVDDVSPNVPTRRIL